MTLGRSSTGAIKIKTDSPGLRAVSCGCCLPAAPCTGYSYEGLEITKAQYDSWRKGGQISISVDIFDTAPKTFPNDPNSCDNGTCSWSYSTSFSVPANTCIFHFTHSSDSNSCNSSYYGETQAPSVNIYAGAYKSIDESGDIYRARLNFFAFCPFRYFFAGGCYMDMCLNHTFFTAFANTGFSPRSGLGSSSISFLGVLFDYLNELPYANNFPSSTANLSLTFTPNA